MSYIFNPKTLDNTIQYVTQVAMEQFLFKFYPSWVDLDLAITNGTVPILTNKSISTTSSGTITSSGLLTASSGASVIGGLSVAGPSYIQHIYGTVLAGTNTLTNITPIPTYTGVVSINVTTLNISGAPTSCYVVSGQNYISNFWQNNGVLDKVIGFDATIPTSSLYCNSNSLTILSGTTVSFPSNSISTASINGISNYALLTGTSNITTTGAISTTGTGTITSAGLLTASNGLAVTGTITVPTNSISTASINGISNYALLTGTSNITTTGAISTTGTGTITSAGLLTASNGLTVTAGAITSIASIDKLTGVVWGTTAFSFATGSNYYMSSGTPAAVTTINFTGLTATSGSSYTFVLILPTTVATNYYNISTCQIAGTSTGVTFKSNISSLATPGALIVQTFSCMYLGTTWYVITSASSY